MYLLISCECGKETSVTEGAAGASLTCECGRELEVPSLDAFRQLPSGSKLASIPRTDTGPVGPSHVDHAAELLNEGASWEEVQRKLIDKGCDEQSAQELVDQLQVQAVFSEAVALLNAGLTPQQVEERLVKSGFPRKFVETALNNLPQPPAYPQPAGGGGLTVLGVIIFCAGLVLMFGNMSGLFPTFPYAGFIVTTIGTLMMGAARTGQEA